MTREDIQLEALAATDGKIRCSVVLGTGVGKTLVGLNHMDRNTTPLMKCLVVAPKKSIFTSWKDDAQKFNKQYLVGRMVFTTYLSLKKHNPADYDVLYLDEAHSLLDNHRVFLENFKGKILGLTGTPPKYKQSERGALYQQFCPVIYTFKADDAIENGILNDYQIIVHKINLGTSKNYQVAMKGKSFLTSEEQNYTYWSRRIDLGSGNMHMLRVMRMKAMMEYPTKERYAKILFNNINSKCILFANTQDQADRLCDYSYHSKNLKSEENLEKFKTGKIMKLSTVLQLNEGVNISNLKQGIIMHAYGNERKASQRIGRLLRLNPDDKAIVHILCYVDTIDEKWVKEALENFDQSKITWQTFNVSY
ncbi:MAG: DEAD/DEAH box helicase family protein [Flavobacteriia bacterium]|nr:DEAD/DEAH box helicase family protein [Flavobacteriia bacterium]